MATEAGKIAEEILEHLAGLPGAQVVREGLADAGEPGVGEWHRAMLVSDGD
jgi:hypothetical protein